MGEVTTPEALKTVVIAGIVGLTIQLISQRSRLPAVLLLLVAGVLLGPSAFGWVNPDSLGEGLRAIVSFGVAIVLFEAGLTVGVVRQQLVVGAVRRLASAGAAISWVAGAILTSQILGLRADISFLVASLMLITGPTVVGPLLRHTRLERHTRHVLHQESIALETIGVFLSLFFLERLLLPVEQGRSSGDFLLMGTLVLRLLTGAFLGLCGGWALDRIARLGPSLGDYLSIAVCAGALGLFIVAEELVSHAGLVAVIVAGLAFARRSPMIRRVRPVARRLAEMFVALIFLLLAADLAPDRFGDLGLAGLAVVAAMMFIVRPLSTWIATTGTGLSWRQRAFIGAVAPRGVITASLAALCAQYAVQRGYFEASLIEPLVFSLVVATIVFHGLTAKPLARLLRITEARHVRYHSSSAQGSRRHRPLVVLAEDDDDIRIGLAALLARNGFDVASLPNGSLLLEYMNACQQRGREPDLVIMDHRMPGCSGLDVLARLKGNQSNVPVVVTTAYGQDVLLLARTIGAAAVFEKPFRPEALAKAALRLTARPATDAPRQPEPLQLGSKAS